jgi:hypothetical protein
MIPRWHLDKAHSDVLLNALRYWSRGKSYAAPAPADVARRRRTCDMKVTVGFWRYPETQEFFLKRVRTTGKWYST